MAKLCNHSRIKPRRNYEATPEEEQLMRKMVDEGKSCYRICQVLGVSQSVVRRWLSERSLIAGESRPTEFRKLNARQEAEFRAFYKTGASVNAITRKFKMGDNTARRIMASLNLDLPAPSAARNQIPANSSQRITINAQEASLYQKQKGVEEAPRESIAARFRRQGLTVADPNR